jgi:spore germination cell wall hydrolase CwlJ-like protein
MSALEALHQPQRSTPLAQAPSPSGATPGADDVTLLARLIFAEGANHHHVKGAMEGIGWSAVNRVGAPGFPKTLEGVIRQPRQFDALHHPLWAAAADPSTLTGPNKLAYDKARTAAENVLQRKISDPTNGAQFFYSSRDGKAPGTWFPEQIRTQRLIRSVDEPIGHFYFLKPNRSAPVDR